MWVKSTLNPALRSCEVFGSWTHGYPENVPDFSWDGRTINASRLGYRTAGLFVERVEAIVEPHRRVALNYFEDGSIEARCPPLRASLHLMA
jgi:phosphoenolpyruvate carboxykinase (diphosphate)